MLTHIKKNLPTISGFIFFLTIHGIFILGVYAKNNKLPFYELITSQMLISIGGASVFIIIFSVFYLILFSFITPFLSEMLFGKISLVSNVDKSLYLLYSLIISFSFYVFSLDINELFIPIAIALLAFIPLKIIINYKANSILFFIKFIPFVFMTTISLILFGFIFIIINDVADTRYYNLFLSIIYFISLIIPVRSSWGIVKNRFELKTTSEIKHENILRHESNIRYIKAISISVIFTLPLFTNESSAVIKFIGVGNENRCYYSEDISKYKIPMDLIEKSKDGTISKVFVIADISNKMYLGKDSKMNDVGFQYSFYYESINRVKCVTHKK